jgi:hypothetical protein
MVIFVSDFDVILLYYTINWFSLLTLNNLHTQVYFISSKHHNIFGTILCLLTFQFGTTDEYIITF